MGTLDQSIGCLIIYHEKPENKLYNNAGVVIENMVQVVEKLSDASRVLKKTH